VTRSASSLHDLLMDSSRHDPRDYFPGFQWAIPLHFADALAACCFSRGDTIYSSPQAYQAWTHGRPQDFFSIQVVAAANEPAGHSGSATFRSNWQSSVTIDLRDHRSSAPPQRIETTQGRLYTTIWHGNVSTLHVHAMPDEAPLTWADINRPARQSEGKLTAPESILERAASQILPHPIPTHTYFLMAFDPTAKLAIEKYRQIRHQLTCTATFTEQDIPSNIIALPHNQPPLPTVMIILFDIHSSDKVAVHNALKAALYIPADTQQTPAKGKFRLRTHGLLFDPAANHQPKKIYVLKAESHAIDSRTELRFDCRSKSHPDILHEIIIEQDLDDRLLIMTCSCPAGQRHWPCRHLLAIIDNDTAILANPHDTQQLHQLATFQTWLHRTTCLQDLIRLRELEHMTNTLTTLKAEWFEKFDDGFPLRD